MTFIFTYLGIESGTRPQFLVVENDENDGFEEVDIFNVYVLRNINDEKLERCLRQCNVDVRMSSGDREEAARGELGQPPYLFERSCRRSIEGKIRISCEMARRSKLAELDLVRGIPAYWREWERLYAEDRALLAILDRRQF